MKNILLFLSIVSTLVLTTLVWSCSTTEKEENITKKGTLDVNLMEIPAVLMGAKIGNIALPDYTKAKRISDYSVQFEFPEGIKYAYRDKDGSIPMNQFICYECSCTGSGCNVFYVGGSFACSECSRPCTGQHVSCGRTYDKFSFEKGIFLDLKSKTKFVTDSDEVNKLRPASDLFFEIPEVISALKVLNTEIYGVEIPSQELMRNTKTKKVALSLYGVLVAYQLPVDYITSAQKEDVTFRDGFIAVSCACTGGSAGCIERYHVGTGSWCEKLECNVCRMQVN